MKIEINRILETLPPSGIRKFFEIVAEEPDVISLSVGEPDFDTPWAIREAAIYALESGQTHYTGNRGKKDLLQAIANYLQRRYKVTYAPDTEILVTNGASEAFDITMRALLNPDDEVLVPAPGYVMYAPLIKLAGAKPVLILPKSNGKFSLKDFQKNVNSRTRILLLSYPNNPTGHTFSKPELKQFAEFALKNKLLVITDEIYAELTYEGTHTTLASLPKMQERTVLISGFSKAWAMTGFRLGYLAGPAPIIAAANKIHQYSALCASMPAQLAAIEALKNCDDEIKKMREEYKTRRDLLIREFGKMGLKINKPAGAFYLFPNIKKISGLNGDEFALRLLKEQKVAVVPGSAFGPEFADHIRISYATSLEQILEALRRIRVFLKKN